MRTSACANKSIYHDIGLSSVRATVGRTGASPLECHCPCARTLNTGSTLGIVNAERLYEIGVHASIVLPNGARKWTNWGKGTPQILARTKHATPPSATTSRISGNVANTVAVMLALTQQGQQHPLLVGGESNSTR